MLTLPDEPSLDAARCSEERLCSEPKLVSALDELDARLSERGIRLRIYAHGSMTVTVAHREGDTEASIEFLDAERASASLH
ncbi:hypothetical protein [Candidatus Poriferisodalis sp.]|uniref:hypothetical protein n=1 Tax=Candidatus Poriferisodalis sp. TaxID=3101277 RepID=UPI003B02686C